jgi:hypothetical protein
MPRMKWRDRARIDAIGWMHRNRALFPDGFTAAGIEQRAAWERVRFDGYVRLVEPEHAMVGYWAADGTHRVRAKHTTYTKQVSKPRSSYGVDRVPRMLCRGSRSVGIVLAQMEKLGAIERIGDNPARYAFPKERLVFGVDPKQPPPSDPTDAGETGR